MLLKTSYSVEALRLLVQIPNMNKKRPKYLILINAEESKFKKQCQQIQAAQQATLGSEFRSTGLMDPCRSLI